MPDHLLLWTLGFFTASFVTAYSARFVDRVRPEWPLARRLLLASFATPLGWMTFQAAIMPFILSDPAARAHFGRVWPSYLQEVLGAPALKLWACSAICAAILWHMRTRGQAATENSVRGYRSLLLISVGSAAAILLPIVMEVWIDTGQISGSFVLLVFVCAFLAGLLPVTGMALLLLQAPGAFAMARFGQLIAAAYALAIAWGAYRWHEAVGPRPGAQVIPVVAAVCMFGVAVGWTIIRRAYRTGRAVAAARARP